MAPPEGLIPDGDLRKETPLFAELGVTSSDSNGDPISDTYLFTEAHQDLPGISLMSPSELIFKAHSTQPVLSFAGEYIIF